MSTDETPDRAALVVGRDLSPEAQRLAHEDGWESHARMHPTTAAEYERKAADHA